MMGGIELISRGRINSWGISRANWTTGEYLLSDAEDFFVSASGSNLNNRPYHHESKSKAKSKTSVLDTSQDSFERMIDVKNCPLCHPLRLNLKAETATDALAVCASRG
jgi:phosphatidylserine decarboxylase